MHLSRLPLTGAWQVPPCEDGWTVRYGQYWLAGPRGCEALMTYPSAYALKRAQRRPSAPYIRGLARHIRQ